MQALKGKKLAFVQMGCKDKEFMEHAMLESEVGLQFFSGQVGKPDIAGAVAEVASYKGAEAVFAPVGQQRGSPRCWTAWCRGCVRPVNGSSRGVVDKVSARCRLRRAAIATGAADPGVRVAAGCARAREARVRSADA
jgi:hypothetical protein